MNAIHLPRGALLVLVTTVAGVVSLAALAADSPPAAPVHPVTDQYFGTDVVDNYRYMENPDDPQVREWMKAQAAYTRSALDALPGREALLTRIHALRNADLSRFGFVRRRSRYFYLSSEPGAELPKLYYRDGLRGDEHLLVDPATLGKGSTTHFALDGYAPSWDGRTLAYGISAGGSEQTVLHVLEVASGRDLGVSIDRAQATVVAWLPDNHSFFYMRYVKPTPGMPPAETKFNARTYLHRIGTDASGDTDPVVFGRGAAKGLDVPDGEGTYIVVAPGSPYAIAVANHNMDANPVTLYAAPLAQVKDAHTPWRKVAEVDDGVTQFHAHGGTLYFLSPRNASRFRVLRTELAQPNVRLAKVVVPEGRAVITQFEIARDGLYLRERDGAVSHLRRVALDGSGGELVPQPFEGSIAGPVTDAREPGALFGLQGWVQSRRVLSYDPAAQTSSDTGLVAPTKTEVGELEAREVFAVSDDGTRIPLSVLLRKGTVLDGSHPTILQGYGAYGNVTEPTFRPTSLAWLERGGVLAYAHVRGGGEYGDDWHRAGQRLTKLNTILDFIACGEYLVDRHYTSPRRLAGLGGSAGGITVGGALTRRPDLFGVILDAVGVSDTLRSETEPNGPPNVVEFGSVRDAPGFHGLYAMSAYAHVRDGVAYPAVLFTTGANDPRVAPWQMAKMAARVQAATSSQRPVLLRVDYDAGHGIGSTASQSETLLADMWSFALWQMEDPAFQPRTQP